MSIEYRISGKDLGQLAMPEFCPRCFWIERRIRGGLPYQRFPGIFASIDSYTKSIVHAWLDSGASSPPWLSDLGSVTGYVNPPSGSRFQARDAGSGILLTGQADAILKDAKGGYIIADYKTARFTPSADRLLPVYRTQLNAYAVIANATGLSPVTGLALIYFEPATTKDDAARDEYRKETGFAMRFDARIFPVTPDPGSIPPLLARARELFDLARPPAGRAGCDNCAKVDALVAEVMNG